jgi:hypothetical protein
MRHQTFTEKHELRLQFSSGNVAFGAPRRTGLKWWPFSERSAHVWCPRCARCHPNGAFRIKDEARRCPYGDCNAPEKNAIGWEEVLAVHPDYPAEPELGVTYPARPDGARR